MLSSSFNKKVGNMKQLIIWVLFTLTSLTNADPATVIKKSLGLGPEEVQKAEANLEVVTQLKQAGVFDQKPNFEGDYYHFYYPRKDIKIFGATLIAFDHEYLIEYVGCCVNPGVALILKKNELFDEKEIEGFAKANSCKVKKIHEIYLPDSVVSELNITKNKSEFVALSCKQSDK